MSLLKEFKCKVCGGHVEFSAEAQSLKCIFCGKEYSVMDFEEPTQESLQSFDTNSVIIDSVKKDEESQQKESLKSSLSKEEPECIIDNSLCSYICQSCGGEIITNGTLGATKCPFCSNNIVINEVFQNDFKPDLVLPFKITKEQAVSIFKSYFENKFLLPKSFKTMNYIEEIKGIYVPFWIFSAKTNTDFNAEGIKTKHYVTYSDRVTENEYYAVYRQYEVNFDSVPVDASSIMDDAMMQSLEPFSVEEAVEYMPHYLAGFYANKYDVCKEESNAKANKRMEYTSKALAKRAANEYDKFQFENYDVKFSEEMAKNVLYPVYTIVVKYKNKPYLFAINGQTGKIVGSLPIDFKKKLFLVLGSFLGSSIIACIAWVIFNFWYGG